MLTQKNHLLQRELAEVYQPNETKNGTRVYVLGGLAVLFFTWGLGLLLTADAVEVGLFASLTVTRLALSIFWFVLAGACVAWWYRMEFLTRCLR